MRRRADLNNFANGPGISSYVSQNVIPQSSRELVDLDQVREQIVALVWPETTSPDRFGIEVEAFPVCSSGGQVAGRLPLNGPNGVLDVVDDVAAISTVIRARTPGSTEFTTLSGGRITFEPGAQVEYSAAPADEIASLRADVDEAWDALEDAFAHRDVALVPLGIDPWHVVADIPQQLEAPRYRAMERYFATGWPAGAVMMRNTSSIQPSLDAGSDGVRTERWLTANLMAPLLVAMFSTSPGRDGRLSLRSQTWLDIDPSRTGLPTWPAVDAVDPTTDICRRVLGANVIFVVRDGVGHGFTPGWSFADWVESPPAGVGPPTTSDLIIHMSTIFAEVRPRNATLELRSVDALPRRWWMVPLVMTAAVLYDDEARGQVIDLLSGSAGSLNGLLAMAAESGLAEPVLGRLSEKVARLAVDAACRQDRLDRQAVVDLEGFVDRFTLRGRAPADEMRPLLDDPPALLGWALAE